MSHDKIKAAARKRMAETGESYAAARREVIREFQAAGIDADEIRLRMADFKVDVPRASVQAVARSSFRTKGTIGVHSKGGR